MNRIQPYLLFLLFFLISSHSNWSADENRNNESQNKAVPSPQRNLAGYQPKHVSFAIDTPVDNSGRHLRTQRRIDPSTQSPQEELLHSHARAITDINKIRFYEITETRINYDNGFFEKVDFFDINYRKLLSSRLTPILLPLWSVQHMTVQDAHGQMLVQPFLCFHGYAYKRNGGRYWR